MTHFHPSLSKLEFMIHLIHMIYMYFYHKTWEKNEKKKMEGGEILP